MVEGIRYETDHSGKVMKTPCPYGKKMASVQIYVASNACQNCRCFLRDERRRKIVYCEHEEL